MRIRPTASLAIVLIIPLVVAIASFAQSKTSPFELLKVLEIKQKDSQGVVYIGKVMTLHYQPNSIEVDRAYYSLLLELTDVLKTPSRESYTVILRGYTDTSGSREANLRLSDKRAEYVKGLLVQNYYMKPERIKAKGFGGADPVASNETVEGRRLNRRVEIHILGDISKAVRFSNKLEGMR